MRIVIALGGNALLERGQTLDADSQELNVRRAIDALAPLAHENELVITHGNGPQVGLLALESATDPALTRPYPLDALGAETQGLIGYWLLQALQNAIPGREVASLITQTLVFAADPGVFESDQVRRTRLHPTRSRAPRLRTRVDRQTRRQLLAPRRRLTGPTADR